MPRTYPQPGTDHQLSPSIIDSTAGFTAGVVSTLAVHPFDVVKTRLQVNQSAKAQVGGSLRIARDIARNEGQWTGFYRGLTPNIIGNSVSWGLYFMWYQQIKDVMQATRGKDSKLRSTDYFLASGASGVLTAVVTNPIWVIKTRMLSSGRNTPGAYTSISDGARQLWRDEGPKGFYRGLIPSLFGVTHGAIQFMVYEQLKIWRMSKLMGQTVMEATKNTATGSGPKAYAELSNWDYLTLSATSKILAGSITYPYQVLRARLQVYDAKAKYSGVRDVTKKIWGAEGLAGFYKGLAPNLVRVLPSTCVTFLVYENMKLFLPRFYEAEMNDATIETTKP